MNKIVLSICILAFVLSMTDARSSRLGSTGRMRKLSAARTIPLTYNNASNQYYVEVIFPNNPSSGNNGNKNNMMIALYGTDNIITGTSTNKFQRFSSSSIGSSVKPVSPYFTGSGFGANISILVPTSDASSLSIGASSFNAHYGANKNVIYMTSLNTKQISNLGSGSYGYLGMSVSNMAANSGITTFSIYLDRFTRNGTLILDSDLSYSTSILSTASWTTNGSWTTTGALGMTVGSTAISTSATTLKFDINANITGVPLAMFQNIITALGNYGVTGCTTDTIQPTCKYAGKAEDLPVLTITNVGGSQTINIPPSVYVSGSTTFTGVTSSIVINLMGLTTSSSSTIFPIDSNYGSSSNPSYVTTQDANTIILDSTVLTYYYTVFSANSDGTGTVKMYIASSPANMTFYFRFPLWAKILVWVGVGILAIGVLIALIYCIKRKRMIAAANAAAGK